MKLFYTREIIVAVVNAVAEFEESYRSVLLSDFRSATCEEYEKTNRPRTKGTGHQILLLGKPDVKQCKMPQRNQE